MTEHKDLLEAAAKAAGITLIETKPDYPLWIEGVGEWAPITSLSDRYDLARRCKLTIDFDEGQVVAPYLPKTGWRVHEFTPGNDLEEALAILRAAAATGEMK